VRTFGKGEALLLSNDKRFAVRFEASELEYASCTSDPADLARFQSEGQVQASSPGQFLKQQGPNKAQTCSPNALSPLKEPHIHDR
jgi:hypothetical protein